MLLSQGEDTAKVEDKIADKRLSELKKTKDKERKELENEMSSTNDNKVKLDINQKMYDLDLISYEEYEKKKISLTKAYEIPRRYWNVSAAAGENMKAVIRTILKQEVPDPLHSVLVKTYILRRELNYLPTAMLYLLLSKTRS
ncbi:hypothetical protein EZS27_040173, partial [termite gut metagenome]